MTAFFLKAILVCLFCRQLLAVHKNKTINLKTGLKSLKNLVDLTRGLSDRQVDGVLSDLTLNDLSTLSHFVDDQDSKDDEYDEDSSPCDNDSEQYVYDGDEEDTDDNTPSANNANGYLSSGAKAELLKKYSSRMNARLKRNKFGKNQEVNVDEEYLKQLENSFPNDQGLKNHEPLIRTKNLVRVKRF